MKRIRVVLSLDAEEVYKYLNSKSKTDMTLFKAVNKKIGLIKPNHHYGEPIAKRLIPKVY